MFTALLLSLSLVTQSAPTPVAVTDLSGTAQFTLEWDLFTNQLQLDLGDLVLSANGNLLPTSASNGSFPANTVEFASVAWNPGTPSEARKLGPASGDPTYPWSFANQATIYFQYAEMYYDNDNNPAAIILSFSTGPFGTGSLSTTANGQPVTYSFARLYDGDVTIILYPPAGTSASDFITQFQDLLAGQLIPFTGTATISIVPSLLNTIPHARTGIWWPETPQ